MFYTVKYQHITTFVKKKKIPLILIFITLNAVIIYDLAKVNLTMERVTSKSLA